MNPIRAIEDAVIAQCWEHGSAPCVVCNEGMAYLTTTHPDAYVIACDTCGHCYDED